MALIPESLKPAVTLGLYALGGTLLLAVTWRFTADRIGEEERRTRQQTLYEIVPRETHTNEMLDDTIQVTAPDALGTERPVTVYRARRNGEPYAVAMEVVAPNGYSGPIRLLVGIRADGTLAGVRVVAHQETPGLGDKIEASKTDWIRQFQGLSLGNPPASDWAVREDGGDFDSFTGATVTPRAVVGAIKRALIYFAEHKQRLFQPSPDEPDATQPDSR